MDTRWQLVAYVCVSIILRMVAAQLSRRRMDIAWVRFFSEGWPTSVLRFAYYIGLPYIALILGVVPGRYLGLVGPGRLQEPASGPTPTLLEQIRDHLSLAFLSWLPDVGTIVGLGVIVMLFLGGAVIMATGLTTLWSLRHLLRRPKIGKETQDVLDAASKAIWPGRREK